MDAAAVGLGDQGGKDALLGTWIVVRLASGGDSHHSCSHSTDVIGDDDVGGLAGSPGGCSSSTDGGGAAVAGVAMIDQEHRRWSVIWVVPWFDMDQQGND